MALVVVLAARADDDPVGPTRDGAMKLPDGQVVRPAGESISYGGRPLDLCLSSDRSLLFVKNAGNVSVINAQKMAGDSGSPVR